MDPVITLTDRCRFYAQEFPDRPAPRVTLSGDREWLEAQWHMGNDYRNASRLYGAYPGDYLERVMVLFPDAARVLHVCSGSLPLTHAGRLPGLPGWHCGVDLRRDKERQPSVLGDAQRLPFAAGVFDLVLVDPPYSPEDAKHYKVKMLDRCKVMNELARISVPGTHVVWLDLRLPMYRKVEWRRYGHGLIVRSTNHSFRGVTFFEREGEPEPAPRQPARRAK